MRYALIKMSVGVEGTDAWTSEEEFVVEYEDDDFTEDPTTAQAFEQILENVSIMPGIFLYECDEYGNEIGEDE